MLQMLGEKEKKPETYRAYGEGFFDELNNADGALK